MGKTLYISDLDGTLLTPEAALSDYTVRALRQFTQNGGYFSVATARTWNSTQYKLAPVLPLPVPVVLMNGAMVYDTQAGRFANKQIIAPEAVRELLARVKAQGQTGFLYSHKEGFIRAYHEANNRPTMQAFLESRKTFYGKNFTQTEDLAEHAAEDIIYFTTQDSHENLAALYEALQGLPEIGCVFYPDSYTIDNWFLECFSRAASKYNAVRFLREAYGFDKVIGFGDNLNDIPLFRACDEGYAVANAREELKAVASGVIGANTEDGVTRFLEGISCL